LLTSSSLAADPAALQVFLQVWSSSLPSQQSARQTQVSKLQNSHVYWHDWQAIQLTADAVVYKRTV